MTFVVFYENGSAVRYRGMNEVKNYITYLTLLYTIRISTCRINLASHLPACLYQY